MGEVYRAQGMKLNHNLAPAVLCKSVADDSERPAWRTPAGRIR